MLGQVLGRVLLGQPGTVKELPLEERQVGLGTSCSQRMKLWQMFVQMKKKKKKKNPIRPVCCLFYSQFSKAQPDSVLK